MKTLPIYVDIVFIVTVIVTLYLFWKSSGFSRKPILILGAWVLLQGVLGVANFYTVTDTLPPRFLFMIAPAVTGMIILFTTSNGKKFIDSLDLKTLVLINVIRVPVEIVLLWLFLNQAIPQVMTFEGKNFDILSGISAPLIYYYGFIKQRINTKLILAWNFICLALVINVVVRGVFSVPSPFQKLSFDQPNIAILYFPYVWLVAIVVPLVLFSHLVMIRRLLKEASSRLSTIHP